MYKNYQNNERLSVPPTNSKLSSNKIVKSLTSFNTKKNISKNFTQQNTIKKPKTLKENKKSKTKRIYCSNKKTKDLGYLLTNPISPKVNKKYKEIKNKNSIRTQNFPSSDHR